VQPNAGFIIHACCIARAIIRFVVMRVVGTASDVDADVDVVADRVDCVEIVDVVDVRGMRDVIDIVDVIDSVDVVDDGCVRRRGGERRHESIVRMTMRSIREGVLFRGLTTELLQERELVSAVMVQQVVQIMRQRARVRRLAKEGETAS
jgi:hypothetical protein